MKVFAQVRVMKHTRACACVSVQVHIHIHHFEYETLRRQ
jgi:hypothetical protein